jgi:hypothetical protein
MKVFEWVHGVARSIHRITYYRSFRYRELGARGEREATQSGDAESDGAGRGGGGLD